jgi:hypothetical protein
MRCVVRAVPIGLGVATLAGLAGCNDALSGTRDAFTLTPHESELSAGATLSIEARSAGRPVAGSLVEWSSRDPSTVQVDRAGRVTALAPGVAWVVGRYDQAVDSVQLVVRFDDLPAEMTAVRLSSATRDETLHLSGVTVLSQLLGVTNPSWMTVIEASNRAELTQTALGGFRLTDDTALTILPPLGKPVVGKTTLEPVQVNPGPPVMFSGHGAILRVSDGSSRLRLYVAVRPATLEITSLGIPSAPGRLRGRLSGRISFEAAGLELDFAAQPPALSQLGDRTIKVFAQFQMPLIYQSFGFGLATVEGSPYAGTYGVGGAGYVSTAGALDVTGLATQNPIEAARAILQSTVTLPAPRVGQFAIAPGGTAQVLARFTPLVLVSGLPVAERPGMSEVATGTGGSVKITAYRAPTSDYSGEVAGTLETTLAFGVSTPSARFTYSFDLPVQPLGTAKPPSIP